MAISMPSPASTVGVPTIPMGTATPTPALTPMEVDHIITVWGQGVMPTDPTECLLIACLLIVDGLVVHTVMGAWQHGVP